MSAAASAEAVGMYMSVSPSDDVAAVPKLDVAIMAAEPELLETTVTADVDVLNGRSFCWTARVKNASNIRMSKQLDGVKSLTKIIKITFNSLPGLVACALRRWLC